MSVVKMTISNRFPAASPQDIRQAERVYARSCILTSWIICAMLTAVFAWTLRHEPFAFPPIAIQLLALLINGLCWWLCTTQIWFKIARPRIAVPRPGQSFRHESLDGRLGAPAHAESASRFQIFSHQKRYIASKVRELLSSN
jgi:hypothetical protein